MQYHPEAAAGPHDASYLFDRFVELMSRDRATKERLVVRNEQGVAAQPSPGSSGGEASGATEGSL